MRPRSLLAFVALLAAFPLASADALRLDVWNVSELDASDDYIDLQFGTSGSQTTLTLLWNGGISDTPGAIGIDMLFINNTSRTLSVVGVFLNTIAAANDVTSAWLPTNGGTQAGGGFGSFIEKVAEPAGRDGVGGNALIFLLDGLHAPDSFVPNSAGAAFAAHVRYANGCSGWVASGGSGGTDSDANCGGGETAVPEPSAALAFGIGLLVVGGALSRRR